jgi:hypothetical protein
MYERKDGKDYVKKERIMEGRKDGKDYVKKKRITEEERLCK